MFAIYLYVYRRKEMTLKRRHSKTRVQTQVPPQHAPNPQSSVLGAISEVTQLGPLFHICSNSQRMCLHFCDLQCCNLCVYRRKQIRMRRSHPITRRQMNAPPPDASKAQRSASGGTSDVSYFCPPPITHYSFFVVSNLQVSFL